MAKKWIFTEQRKKNIKLAHKKLSTYVKLGKRAYAKGER